MIFEVAHHMALLPAAAVLCWRRKDAALWGLAAAFLVSWVADYAGHWTEAKRTASVVYPVLQSGLVLVVVLERRLAAVALAGIVTGAVVAVLTLHGAWPDLVLRSVCWGAVVASVWPRADLPVRPALLTYFGLGLLAWAGYVASPGWTSWGVYQGVRFVGLALFSAAVWKIRATAR